MHGRTVEGPGDAAHTVILFLLNDGASASSNRPAISVWENFRTVCLIVLFTNRYCAYLPNIKCVLLIVYLFFYFFSFLLFPRFFFYINSF